MPEQEFHVSKLLAGYFRNQLRPDQEEELDSWKNRSADNLKYFNQLNDEYIQKTELRKFQALKSEVETEIWNKTLARTGLSLQLPAGEITPGRTIKIPLLSRWIAAASIVLVVGTGIYFYAAHSGGRQNQHRQDVAPGSFGATLTLANGEKIKLAEAKDGQLVKEAGIVITKTADGRLTYEITPSGAIDPKSVSGKMNTLSTAKGETYQIKLPDGSLVALNAASSLTYPTSFRGLKMRTVKLDGEGYFEVAKDKAHPFVVESQDQKVEVLGTRFNISSYQDDEVKKTTLIEGSVKMSAGGTDKVLKPGEQGKLRNNKIEVIRVDTKLATAWKDNEFMFEGESIESIMKMVERWYNVQVVYRGEKPKDKFVGGVSRFDNVSKVLRILESTGRVHFEIEGRIIYVQR